MTPETHTDPGPDTDTTRLDEGHDDPGDGAEKHAIEPPADGTETELVADPPPVAPPTDAQLQALGRGLQAMAQTADAHARQTRREDGVVFGPSGSLEAMLRDIARKNHEVTAARREWEGLKGDAAEAKKTYDALAKQLSDLIDRCADKAEATEGGRQPYLRPVDEPEAPSGPTAPADGCAFERDHGIPCAICRGLAGAEVPTAPGDVEAIPPSHARHVAVAERFSLERLAALLEQRQVFVDWQELNTLDRLDVEGLASWCAETEVRLVPPPVLVRRAHVAEAPTPGDPRAQRCGICGTVLLNGDNLPGGDDPSRQAWFPTAAYVGLDCEGARPAEVATPRPPVGDAPDPTEPETARILPMRGAKKRRKKATPEGEQAAQLDEPGADVDDE